MKATYSSILMLLSVILFASCEEVIDLELEGTENPLVVIDAHVINREGYSYVRVTSSSDFYAPQSPPPISGAAVRVTDDLGNTELFLEDSTGTYLPQNSTYVGEENRTYTLEVEVQGQTFTATSILFPVIDVDSLTVEKVEDELFKDDGYYIYFYATEPQDEENYYRWKVYKNGIPFDGVDDLLIADDEFVRENIENLELPFAFELGDSVRFEQYSLTEESYKYYLELQNLVFSDGGLFSSPPVNPPTNIQGGALGVFSTSAMVSRDVVIEE